MLSGGSHESWQLLCLGPKAPTWRMNTTTVPPSGLRTALSGRPLLTGHTKAMKMLNESKPNSWMKQGSVDAATGRSVTRPLHGQTKYMLYIYVCHTFSYKSNRDNVQDIIHTTFNIIYHIRCWSQYSNIFYLHTYMYAYCTLFKH